MVRILSNFSFRAADLPDAVSEENVSAMTASATASSSRLGSKNIFSLMVVVRSVIGGFGFGFGSASRVGVTPAVAVGGPDSGMVEE